MWTFVIKDVNVKLDQNETINAEKIRIVACNAKKAGDVWLGLGEIVAR